MLKVFEAATSSAVPTRVMIARQPAICPGASQRPPAKVMITMPVMRGLASATTARNQARPGKRGRPSGRAASTVSTIVPRSAVATAR